MVRNLGFVGLLLGAASAFNLNQPWTFMPRAENFVDEAKKSAAAAAATATLAALLTTSEPALASSTAAAQIHLNSLPPTTVSVQIGDLPIVGKLVSGTYTKVNSPLPGKASVTIKSPADKFTAVKDAATRGHLEFDVDGLVTTHLDVDIAADTAGVATVRVMSPVIPQLPYKNSASGTTSKLSDNAVAVVGPSKTAAQISLNSLPPSAISVEIEDLPVFGKLFSGVYTKVDAVDKNMPAAITIESPKDKFSAIRAVTTGGHLEFDVDGLLVTHLDVDIAADKAGVATVRVVSPVIPQLPYKNKASIGM